MDNNHSLPVIYSCSGCSSAAQMANWIAVKLDREGLAEMSCIAGVGAGVKPLVQKAKKTDFIIGVDGCPLACVEHCLANAGLKSSIHYDLSKLGVRKLYHKEFDLKQAEKIKNQIKRDMNLNYSQKSKEMEQ